MNLPIILFLGVSIIFGLIAGLMAYLITYSEYIHHYRGNKEPKRMALKTAMVAFFFFFIVSFLVGLLYRP